jgi:hypothetical protein
MAVLSVLVKGYSSLPEKKFKQKIKGHYSDISFVVK